MAPEPGRRLTVPEAAQRAGVSVKTIRRAIHRGDLQAVQPRGVRKISLLEADVDAWALTPYQPRARAPAKAPLPPRRRTPRGSREALKSIEEHARRDQAQDDV